MPTNLGLDAFVIAAEGAANDDAKEAALRTLYSRAISSATTPLGLVSRTDFAIPVIPVGTVVRWTTDTVPSGYLECNGQSVSSSTYSALYDVIGTTFGGSGSTFKVPDYRRRVSIGAGGARPPGSLGPGTNIGDTGGRENVTITGDTLPRHGHPVSMTLASITGHDHVLFKYARRAAATATGAVAVNDLIASSATIPSSVTIMDPNFPHKHRVRGNASLEGHRNPAPITITSKAVVTAAIIKT